MDRHKIVRASAVMGFALAACGSASADTASTVPTPTASTGATALIASTAPVAITTDVAAVANPGYPNGLRGVRYCEVLLLGREGPDFVARVWNTMGHSDCPSNEWEALDAAAIAAEHSMPLALLNGPRYWTLDAIESEMQLTAPVEMFGALEMFLAATVNLGPELPAQSPYTERPVARETVFRFWAGSEIHVLTDPDGTEYVMQSFSQQIDPTLSIDQLPGLGGRLALPEGWTFSTEVLTEDRELLSRNAVATVVQDDLQNTYQRDETTVG
jgi:hypothetical protein